MVRSRSAKPLFAGSIPAPALKSHSGFVDKRGFFSHAGSIDSLAAASSPLRALSMSLGSRRLHSRPRLQIIYDFRLWIADSRRSRLSILREDRQCDAAKNYLALAGAVPFCFELSSTTTHSPVHGGVGLSGYRGRRMANACDESVSRTTAQSRSCETVFIIAMLSCTNRATRDCGRFFLFKRN